MSKLKFVKEYGATGNAADNSKYDANANVTQVNITTLAYEMHKLDNIRINRQLLVEKITETFGEETAQKYSEDLESHLLYCHDESSLFPYCVSISLYPFLVEGLKPLGGESGPPKHLWSFAGSFINLMFAVSAQFAGAVASVEFLNVFDHFARKDFGEDYLKTKSREVNNYLQQIMYNLNQPAAVRNWQSIFFNFSILDENYFHSLFEGFYFPDGDKPNWESVKKLQVYFMKWLNKERESALLTFPVVTAAMLTKGGKPVDVEFEEFCAEELSQGNSFFIYQSDSVDSLSSCCRLRNEIEKEAFSYSLGAGGIMTGSINVMTLNMNRLIQKGYVLQEVLDRFYKYQVSYRKLMEDFQKRKLLTIYDAGYINMNKQFLTLGINGMVEAAESLGIKPNNNSEYKEFVCSILKQIYDSNREATKKFGYKFNTEFVPAENLGIKNAKWDKKEGLKVERDCYNSYFYPVEDEEISILDKFTLHGRELNQYLDGGSALHLNLEDYPDKEQYKKLIRLAALEGCNYFCTNIPTTFCEDCGYIGKKPLDHCVQCESKNISHCTRIIGYLKKVRNFSKGRQEEHEKRFYQLLIDKL